MTPPKLTFVPNRGLTTHSHSRLDASKAFGKFGEVSSTGFEEPNNQTGVGEDMCGPHSSNPQDPRCPGVKIFRNIFIKCKVRVCVYLQLPRGQLVG